jgi:hypothetical protein
MTVDVRTRVDTDIRAVDPVAWFDTELPERLEAAGERLEPAVRQLAPRALTIAVDGDRWTLVTDDGRARVERGGRPETRTLTLTPAQVEDLVNDQATPMTWFSTGTLVLEGRIDPVLDWWMLIRAAIDGTTPHVAGAIDFNDGDGSTLDLGRVFTIDSPRDEMRSFLETAGFLHLSGVFTKGEMEAVSRDMDAAAPGYSDGDGRSGWAGTADGTRRLVRMQGFDEVSPAVESLVTDERLARLGEITGAGHRWGQMKSNRIEALEKPVGIVEGLSDVPWHKDCSLGRHSYECSSLTVGVSVTGADAASGQLRVVAGSHRALTWPAYRLRDDLDLPVVDLPTETGDVTMHLSCTLHMAQPPVERERRVLYTGFRLPLAPGSRGDGRDRLRTVRETAAVTVSQPPSPVKGDPRRAASEPLSLLAERPGLGAPPAGRPVKGDPRRAASEPLSHPS